mmetsp:Transcript_26800/g.63751  ORF Transcript_26800/g.63751 Transcript_26800/m.63751 type:complete len:176 (-) Transcript_26800:50-577(-)
MEGQEQGVNPDLQREQRAQEFASHNANAPTLSESSMKLPAPSLTPAPTQAHQPLHPVPAVNIPLSAPVETASTGPAPPAVETYNRQNAAMESFLSANMTAETLKATPVHGDAHTAGADPTEVLNRTLPAHIAPSSDAGGHVEVGSPLSERQRACVGGGAAPGYAMAVEASSHSSS